MNKYKEPLNKILNCLGAIEKVLWTEDIMLLNELVDKENPKAPIPTPMAHLYGTYNCPNCKNPLPMKHNALKKKAPRLYCDRCGQKIDWDKVRG